MSKQEQLQTLIQGLQKKRNKLKEKYGKLLEEYHHFIKSISTQTQSSLMSSEKIVTSPVTNSNLNLSASTNSQSSSLLIDATTSLLLSNTTFPLSTEPTNILHQNILFQRIHHLLLQYEKFIRDLRRIKDFSESRELNSQESVHLEQKLLSELAKSCLEDAKGLIKLMAKLAPHVLHSSSWNSQDSCYLCRQKLEPLCYKCIQKIRSKRDVIALKKFGNQLLQKKCEDLQVHIENQGLTKRLEYLKKNYQIGLKQQHCDYLKKRVELLKRRVSDEQNKNQQIREQIEQQKKTLEHARNMLSEKQKQLQEYRTSFEKKKQEVANLHNELIATRRRLITDLISIMPLYLKSENEVQFVNISLSITGNYDDVKDKELLNASFGNLVHFINLLSKYLHVPLPYRMTFRGNNSFICKPDEDKKYLLSYSKNSDFEIARQLLNANILYLCSTQRLIFEGCFQPQYTFINVYALVRHLLNNDFPRMKLFNYKSICPKIPDRPRRLSMTERLGTVSLSESALGTQSLSPLPQNNPNEPQIRVLVNDNNNNNANREDDTGLDLTDFIHIDYLPPLPENENDIRHFERAFEDHSHPTPEM